MYGRNGVLFQKKNPRMSSDPRAKQCQHVSNQPDSLADKNMKKKVTKPIVGHIGIEEVIKKYITH